MIRTRPEWCNARMDADRQRL